MKALTAFTAACFCASLATTPALGWSLAEMKAQIEVAQDMLAGTQNQRNATANECVQLFAQLSAANRRIAELERVIASTKSAKPDHTNLDDIKRTTQPNGKSAQVEARA